MLAAVGGAREPPRLVVALSYKVDPGIFGCPAEPDFRRAVTQPLGYDPFRNEAAHLVTAQVQSSERGLEGQVLWTDAAGNKEGERRLSSANRDCAELARGMTFAIAVQLQLLNSSARREADSAGTQPRPGEASASVAPAASAAPSGSAPPAAAPPAPVPPPPSAPAPAPDVAPPETADKGNAAGSRSVAPAERFLAAGLGLRADVGFGPSPGAGARVFGAARYDTVSFELAAFANLPTRYRQDDGTGFSLRAFGATFAPCGHLRRLAFCALGVVGRMQAEGFGVDEVRAPSSTFVQAGLRAALDLPFGQSVAARLYADGLATLTPRTVTLNQAAAWTTPAGAIGVGLDLIVLFR